MGNQFIMPKQVFYGENALKDAADVIATLGKKALVVTDWRNSSSERRTLSW